MDDNANTMQPFRDILSARAFSQEEIQNEFVKFRRQYPTGRINVMDFVDRYSLMFPVGDARSYAEFVFNAYDRDEDGTIDFKEFMTTLTVAARGGLEDKLRWVFDMFDINHDGRVSRREARQILAVITPTLTRSVWKGGG